MSYALYRLSFIVLCSNCSSQVKQDNSQDTDPNAVVYRDTCISELPTQANFDLGTRTVIQVASEQNSVSSREMSEDDGTDGSEPPLKRAYHEESSGGQSAGISKLVEFCSKDIK